MHFNTIKSIVHTITGTVCILGLLGHILALYVFIKLKKKSYNSVVLCALSVTDILILLYNISHKLVIPNCHELKSCACLEVARHHYQWVLWIYLTMCMIWIIVMATFGRYMAVCHAHGAYNWWEPKYGVAAVVAVVVVSAVFMIPLVVLINHGSQHAPVTNQTTVSNDVTNPTWDNSTTMVGTGNQSTSSLGDQCLKHLQLERRRLEVLDFIKQSAWWCPYHQLFQSGVVMYVVPMVILLCLNTKLVIALKRTDRFRLAGTTSAEEEKESHAATVNIVAIVIAFMVLHSPFLIQALDCLHHVDWTEQFWLFYHSLPAYNSAVDFILYFLFYETFRKEAKRLLVPPCCRSRAGVPFFGVRWRAGGRERLSETVASNETKGSEENGQVVSIDLEA